MENWVEHKERTFKNKYLKERCGPVEGKRWKKKAIKKAGGNTRRKGAPPGVHDAR